MTRTLDIVDKWPGLVVDVPEGQRLGELAVVPPRDADIKVIRSNLYAYNATHGLRVGDFVKFQDDSIRRVCHICERNGAEVCFQPQSNLGDGSYSIGDGYCSYSGGLDSPVTHNLMPAHKWVSGFAWSWGVSSGAHMGINFWTYYRLFLAY